MYVLARRAALVSRTAIFLNNQWTIASPLSSLLQDPIQTNAASRNVDPTDKKFNSAPAAENMHEDYVPKFLYDELLIKYGKLTDAKNELDLIKYPIKLRSEMEWYENMIASGFVADETKLQGFKDDGARRVQSRYLKWVFTYYESKPCFGK
ncbi:uncharacterized protein LOC135844623 isoform X2 [Planococcus citri]|uniref:uncharacterized protein LOC135844623 isoform X2 n=1 Tax=Planococcus citri TaxID=170843 RepID=UPI0031F9FE95